MEVARILTKTAVRVQAPDKIFKLGWWPAKVIIPRTALASEIRRVSPTLNVWFYGRLTN